MQKKITKLPLILMLNVQVTTKQLAFDDNDKDIKPLSKRLMIQGAEYVLSSFILQHKGNSLCLIIFKQFRNKEVFFIYQQ